MGTRHFFTESCCWRDRTRLIGRWLKDELREIVECFFPMLEVMRVFVHMPDMGHFVFLEIGMHALTDTDEAILVPAGDEQKL